MTAPAPGVRVERKTRSGVGYWHVTFPTVGDWSVPEFVLNCWDDGRVTIDSGDVAFAVESLHRFASSCSVGLRRTPLAPGFDEQNGPPS